MKRYWIFFIFWSALGLNVSLLGDAINSDEVGLIRVTKGNAKQITQILNEAKKRQIESIRNSSSEEKIKFINANFSSRGASGEVKRALAYEAHQQYEEALQIYQGLIGHEEALTKESGIPGELLLYSAIQRTAEFSGATVIEKKALVWLRDNVLNIRGRHHSYSNQFEEGLLEHIRLRLEQFKSDRDSVTVKRSGNTFLVFPKKNEEQAENLKLALDKSETGN